MSDDRQKYKHLEPDKPGFYARVRQQKRKKEEKPADFAQRQEKNKQTLDKMGVKVNERAKQKFTMKQVRQYLDQAYKVGVANQKTPLQVQKEIIEHQEGQMAKLFKRLHTFASSPMVREKISSAAWNKIRAQTSKKLNVPIADAQIIILLDDWFDDIKQKAGHLYQGAKKFVSENKEYIYPMVEKILSTINPSLGRVGGTMLKTFGGRIQSEDPYCVDVEYMKYIFGGVKTRPAPRKQTHYMYQMNATLQVPVTIIADGTGLVVINPDSAFKTQVFTANASYLPFVSVCRGNTDIPFGVSPQFTASPFFKQGVNTMTYGIDSIQVDYINTQSPLNVKGKVTTAFFYEPPNKTWTLPSITWTDDKPNPEPDIFWVKGKFNTTVLSISNTQLVNDKGYVMRKSNKQCQTLTRLGTYILEQNKQDLRSHDPSLFSNPTLECPNIEQVNQNPYILVKFTGCTPGAIGTIFLKVSASIQPVAAMRNILSVTPRGSYQGFYRAVKQARKMGIPLQFLTMQQASFLFKEHFGQINFDEYQYGFEQGYGAGQAIVPVGFKLLLDPQDNGFCVSDCLTALKIDHQRKPWMTQSDVQSLNVNVLLMQRQRVVGYVKKNQRNQYIVLNAFNRHAYIVTMMNAASLISEFTSCGNKYQVVELHDLSIVHDDLHFAPSQIQYPIKAHDIPISLKDLFIKQEIVIGSNGSFQKPMLQFDLTSVQGFINITRNGDFTCKDGLMHFTNRKTGAFTLLKRPLVYDVQTITGELVGIDGCFVMQPTLTIPNFYYKTGHYSQQLLQQAVKHQLGLVEAGIKQRLQTIQPNPGPAQAYSTFRFFKCNQKKTSRKRMFIRAQVTDEGIDYFEDLTEDVGITADDIDINDPVELIKKVSERSPLNVHKLRNMLKL